MSMGIYLPNMELPKLGYREIRIHPDGTVTEQPMPEYPGYEDKLGKAIQIPPPRIIALRKKLFEMIKAELEDDPYCKSYEGCLEVICDYPDYFEDEEAARGPSYYCIRLHCYVLGPSRHYDFTGKTMNEALDKLEKALNKWAEEAKDGEQD